MSILIHHRPPASLANKLVDLYATSAQCQPFPPPPVPVPSFTMDWFTPFHPSFGYVETNLSSFMLHLLAFTLSQDSSFQPLRRLPHFLYNSHLSPAHPYLHATSAFLATLQLYLRSSQLDTADVRYCYWQLGDTALCCHPGRASMAHTFHLSCYSFGQSSNVICIVCHFTCLLLYCMWAYLSTCHICCSVCGFFVYALFYSALCYH